MLLGLPSAANASPSRAEGLACTKPAKARRQAVAAAYAKGMLKARAHYFKTHKGARLRARFVKKQKAKLKTLRAKASCKVAAPPVSPPPPPPPPPIDLNPAPTANETFTFGPGMASADDDQIKGDIAFAAEDVQRLVGISLDRVTVFASTDATWLAGQQCGFYGYGGSCVADTAAHYASGNSSAQGGPGAVFLYWAAASWQFGAASNQKIIAHELFHALQYQIDHLIHAGETPPDQIRPSGPVWLDEGAPETIGYRVMADRQLGTYANELAGQIGAAKHISAPLDQLERLSQTSIPGVYSLFLVSVDHLARVAPAGLPALAAYYRALGTGAAWPDAFQQAFGMTVSAYYADFAAYRATL